MLLTILLRVGEGVEMSLKSRLRMEYNTMSRISVDMGMFHSDGRGVTLINRKTVF